VYLQECKKEIPETNFDLNVESSFEEIKDLNPTYFRTLFIMMRYLLKLI